MNDETKVKFIVILGRSGAGKDSVVKGLCCRNPRAFHMLKRVTTRPKRDLESNIFYDFVSSNKMYNLIENDELVEADVHNGGAWVYGIKGSELRKSKINVVSLSPEGLASLAENANFIILSVLLSVNEKQLLLRSLGREINPDVREIIRRFLNDDKQFAHFDTQDYNTTTISNDGDLSCTIEAIEKLVETNLGISRKSS